MRTWMFVTWFVATLTTGCGIGTPTPTLVETRQISCPPVWPSLNCPPEVPVVNDRAYEDVVYDLLELHQECLAADRVKNKARAACP